MDFEPVQGSIIEFQADAIVNSASTTLEMRRGYAGTLRRAANGPINEEAIAKGPVRLGQTVVTKAYELDANYVIHAAVIPDYGDGRATADSIRDGVRNSLRKADRLGCDSILVPTLGCGIVGFDTEKGVEIIADEIWRYTSETIEEVYFNGFTDEEMHLIRLKRESLISSND